MKAATARLEVRVRPDSKARLEQAASLTNVALSDFVRSAAEDRAEQILADHESTTRVPAEFFEDLLAALDTPVVAKANLAHAARRAASLVTRE